MHALHLGTPKSDTTHYAYSLVSLPLLSSVGEVPAPALPGNEIQKVLVDVRLLVSVLMSLTAISSATQQTLSLPRLHCYKNVLGVCAESCGNRAIMTRINGQCDPCSYLPGKFRSSCWIAVSFCSSVHASTLWRHGRRYNHGQIRP